MQGNYTCDMSELLRQQTEKANLPNQIADEPEESLPVIEKATADTEKDARPGIFFCTHPAQADMHRQNRK